MARADEKSKDRHSAPSMRALYLAADVLLLNVAFQLAFYARFSVLLFQSPETLGGAPKGIYNSLELYLTAVWIGISLITRLYGDKFGRPSGRVRDLFKMIGFLATAILIYIVALGGYNFYSRIFLLYFFLFSPIILLAFRLILSSTATLMHTSNSANRDILIIGAGRTGERFYSAVNNNSAYGYHVIGFLDDNGIASKVRPMILGKLSDFPEIASSRHVDEVVIALPKANEESIAQLVTQCEDQFIRVNVIPNDYAAFEGKRVIEEVGEFSLVRMREAPLDLPQNKALKRTFDIVFSLIILLVLFPPVFLVSGILILLTSRGPIFFKQMRTGEVGASFICYKFRTMRNLPRELADSQQAVPNDPRITWIGSLLRRMNLDELPQFWNVLKGEMSVVGPRPHMLKHTADYRKIIGNYMVRHFVKPGLTGWAQINGLRGATMLPDKMERRIKYDVYYIENWSFIFDLTIIWRTIILMLKGDKSAY